MIECPGCGSDMETKAATGRQRGVTITVSWERCPDCGFVIDPSGNRVPPDESRDHDYTHG